MSTEQLLEATRLADIYGNGEMRLTIGQNLIIPNISDENLAAFQAEPLLRELRYDPSEVMRGLVSCTGVDYCHFALIDTKILAMQAAQ
jgi:ferredoxin-nitrite reductase